MGKQTEGHEDNIVLFPGLVDRLVEKGMSALKEKKYYEALNYFQQSIELEHTQSQARYGLVITNIELNRLEEAKKHCESMLHEGVGQYYEVLQVYVSLLVQLGNYSEVETILESVISEEKLPPKMAESFYQLLEFSRQMTDSSSEIETLMEEEPEFNSLTNKEEWIRLLEQGKPEQQWGAIQKLKQVKTEEVKKTYEEFLKGKNNNPVLKSYLLQILMELDVKGTFEVYKFGETFKVHIENLEDVFHEKFGSRVIQVLEGELGQESPSLFEMVQQVWWHYLFALYPKSPEPLDASVWAAALHITGVSLMNGEEEAGKIAKRYSADEAEVMKAVKHMKGIESQLYMIQNHHT
ncbi:tetratricopeptide repeat protein [Bacillus alkalicola]|nr:tetratricopeptide repeat protein [Bacillus alkalicola]